MRTRSIPRLRSDRGRYPSDDHASEKEDQHDDGDDDDDHDDGDDGGVYNADGNGDGD